MTVFARIDHAAGARRAGLVLRPMERFIFGNGRARTTLMKAAQTMGIDLPPRMLVWEDDAGKAWLCWNDPRWLAAAEHCVGPEAQQAIDAITASFQTLAAMATRSEG